MTVDIFPSRDAVICINNTAVGFVKAGDTMPIYCDGNIIVSAFDPFGKTSPVWCNIKDGKLLPSPGRLCMIDCDHFFLDIFMPCALPPIVIKEQFWLNGYCGLCGEFFVFQQQTQTTYFSEQGVLSYKIVGKYAILFFRDKTVFVNSQLSVCLTLPKCEIEVEQSRIIANIFPEDMRFFTVVRVYSLSLELLSTTCKTVAPTSNIETAIAFCQGIRYGISDVFDMLTPEAKSAFTFEQAKEFLGSFDLIKVKSDNTLLLRYMIDEYNFHYMCYKFDFVHSTPCDLIDNISEV